MPKVSTKSLSPTRIERAKVKRAKDGTPKVSYLWDSSIRGFGLRITTQGTKSFCMKFIEPDGKQAWIALGHYTGEKSYEEAKAQAASFRGMLMKGLDPRNEVKKHLLIPTFSDFVTEHLNALKERLTDEEKAFIAFKLTLKKEWLPPYLHATKVFLEKFASPTLGSLRLNEITRNHIQELVDDTAKGRRPWMKPSEKPKKTTRTAANRLHAAISKLFTEAERKGHITQGANPCKLVVKQAESKGRERFLTLIELEWLGKVLKDAPKWGDKKACPYAWTKVDDKEKHLEIPTAYALAAIRLLVLTGARLSEILNLRWSQVDRTRKIIRLENHKTSKKTGAKELPISDAVEAILTELEQRQGRELKGEWVLQGHRHGAHLVNLQKPWGRIRKAVALASEGAVNLDDLRIHDLRHSFASVAVSQGHSLSMIGSLLGHTQAATTQRYSHLHTDPRLQASEKISNQISSALG